MLGQGLSDANMPASKSQTLRIRLGITSGLLSAATKRFLERPELPGLIPSHLVLLHQIVRATVPLMETACKEARRTSEDVVCHGLADYLVRFMEEERHHDEWILEDLESIGIGRAQILKSAPPPNVAALVGAQYYWILHHHPIALLGYTAMLESNAPSVLLIDRLQAQTGLPKSAFRTLRLHAVLDPDHQKQMDAFIDDLPLDARHETLIGVSAAHTGATFAYCMAGLRPWENAA